MIFLQSIHIQNFKGIRELTCSFEDITVLTGLNNSGKTTILQAIHLLVNALLKLPNDERLFHENKDRRRVALSETISSLSIQDRIMLIPRMEKGIEGTIKGSFSSGFCLELVFTYSSDPNFTILPLKGQSQGELLVLLQEQIQYISEFVIPPGIIQSRETMLDGNSYRNTVNEGRSSQLWRNAIWWSIQEDGFEVFEEVKKLVSVYFPEVEMLVPTLSTTGQPDILLKYKDQAGTRFDIIQSGSGLRTFLTLARLLKQSSASIYLLDEPDAHLHASQQGVILDLLMDTALNNGKQVIITTHSPEMITRSPIECVRWIEREQPNTQSGDMEAMLEKLGVTPDIYVPSSKIPDLIVYVEGKTDKPVIESLISWCRRKSPNLPYCMVVPHKDGRFDEVALQGIRRVLVAMGKKTKVVGIRDLDWYYENPLEPPDGATPYLRDGEGWTLLTLPCKELENLFCDAAFLYFAFEQKIQGNEITNIIDDESLSDELVNEWGYQVKHRIRDASPSKYDPSTKEKEADELFNAWKTDSEMRRRLVAGKRLLSRVRERIKREHGLNQYPQRMFDSVPLLTPMWNEIANAIFPGIEFRSE